MRGLKTLLFKLIAPYFNMFKGCCFLSLHKSVLASFPAIELRAEQGYTGLARLLLANANLEVVIMLSFLGDT